LEVNVGKIILPEEVGQGMIKKQVSNIPLTCPGTPASVTEIKGCKFTPAVYLDRGKLYLVVVSQQLPGRMIPKAGFYDVPEKSYLSWIGSFKIVAVSAMNMAGYFCHIFEAFEADAPKDCIPVAGYIEGERNIRTDMIEVKRENRLLI
jgi:hypothetical protein